MGSSAGGHLASTIATHGNGRNRPAFQILFYPVISMTQGLTHDWTHHNFLGKIPGKEMESLYSNERQVSATTPPAIILVSDDDDEVSPLNSIVYYSAMHNKCISCTVHIYPTGGHGWGYLASFPHHCQMLADLDAWLRKH